MMNQNKHLLQLRVLQADLLKKKYLHNILQLPFQSCHNPTMNTHLAEFKVCFVHASECIHMQDDAEPDKQTGTHTHR